MTELKRELNIHRSKIEGKEEPWWIWGLFSMSAEDTVSEVRDAEVLTAPKSQNWQEAAEQCWESKQLSMPN